MLLLNFETIDDIEGAVPVAIAMEPKLQDNPILTREIGEQATEIPYQIDTLENKLWFLARSEKGSSSPITYYFTKGNRTKARNPVSLKKRKEIYFSLLEKGAC